MLAIIPVQLVHKGQRLRSVSEAQVVSLMDSIGEIGLLNPITVFRTLVVQGNVNAEGYGLVAGAHRLEAFTRLGLEEIEANVVELSDLQRQIAECDENLRGPALSKSERAYFTMRRKDAYEALHPQTRHGAVGRAGYDEKSGQLGHSFAEVTAEATGHSARAIRRDAERAEKIADKALELVRHTNFDTGSFLDELKAVPRAEQVQYVKAKLEDARPAPKAKDVDHSQAFLAALDKHLAGASDDILTAALDRITAELEARSKPGDGGDKSKRKADPAKPELTQLEELSKVLDADRAAAVVAHRKNFKAKFTPYAARLLAEKLAQCADPNTAADTMICNGWQGFEPKWLQERSDKAVQSGNPQPLRQNERLRRELLGEYDDQIQPADRYTVDVEYSRRTGTH